MKGLDGERIDNFPLPRIPFDEIESKCIIDVSKMLLIKRKWFKYENEVRLVSIFDNNTNIDYKDDYLLLYKCDISKLIKSITISPFVCRDVFKCITNKIQDKYPSVKCKIYRPDIFDIISEKEQGSYYI
jgi:hypothetical protein